MQVSRSGRVVAVFCTLPLFSTTATTETTVTGTFKQIVRTENTGDGEHHQYATETAHRCTAAVTRMRSNRQVWRSECECSGFVYSSRPPMRLEARPQAQANQCRTKRLYARYVHNNSTHRADDDDDDDSERTTVHIHHGRFNSLLGLVIGCVINAGIVDGFHAVGGMLCCFPVSVSGKPHRCDPAQRQLTPFCNPCTDGSATEREGGGDDDVSHVSHVSQFFLYFVSNNSSKSWRPSMSRCRRLSSATAPITTHVLQPRASSAP